MSTLTRITLGRLAVGGVGGIVVPGVVDAAVEASMAARVSIPSLLAQVNQGLAISVAKSIITSNVQASLSVQLDTIQVEVDIC